MAMGQVAVERFTSLHFAAEVVRTLAVAGVAVMVVLSVGHAGDRSSANAPAVEAGEGSAPGRDDALHAVGSRSQPHFMFIVESDLARAHLLEALAAEATVSLLLGEPARDFGVAVVQTRPEVAQLVLASVDFAVLPVDLTSFED